VAFGPHPRSYEQDMPKKMRRAAVRSALSQKLADQEIIVVDKFELPAPKTRELLTALKALGVTKGLLVLPGHDTVVENSARNVDGVKTLFATYLNIRDIFKYDHIVVSLDALNKIQEWLG
jgi:large subunit ribosomal protein L4